MRLLHGSCILMSMQQLRPLDPFVSGTIRSPQTFGTETWPEPQLKIGREQFRRDGIYFRQHPYINKYCTKISRSSMSKWKLEQNAE